MRRVRGYGSEIGVYILPQAAWWAIDVSPIAGRQTTALPQYERDKDVPVALVAHSCAPSPWLCIIDGPPTSDFYTGGMEFFQIPKTESASRPMHAKLHTWEMRGSVCGVLLAWPGLSGWPAGGPGGRRPDRAAGRRTGAGRRASGRVARWGKRPWPWPWLGKQASRRAIK